MDKKITDNGWGLTKLVFYQLKNRQRKNQFCLSPCYVSVFFLKVFFRWGAWAF